MLSRREMGALCTSLLFCLLLSLGAGWAQSQLTTADQADGSWHKVETGSFGSYTTFTTTGTEVEVAFVPAKLPIWAFCAGGAALLVLLLSIPLLYKMRWGHYITTLGGNPVALRRCGVRTGAWRISTFAVMGFLAALAGIIISARLNSAEPNAGLNMEMDAITAVILGGTPLHGGSAALAGTAVAVLLLGTIRNGLTLMSVSSYYQQFITGAILLCAVVTAEIRERRRLH
mgnify:CR=1 FL=1